MQPLDESKKLRRYCCSNPKCNKVFSKPKIIKYYVCPSCQTLVDLDSENFHPPILEKPVFEEKQVRKQEELLPSKNQEPEAKELIPNEPVTTSNESISFKKPEVNAELEPTKPAQKEQFNAIEYILGKKLQNEVDGKVQSSDSQCQYFFGYLSEKNKGKGVPEACFACPKSIECMLSQHSKSKESLEEIKKWYSLKH